MRDERGEPLNALDNWGAANYALDTTHPEALEWIAQVIRTVCDDWGFEYLKLDFVYAAAMRGQRHDPNLTGVQAYRKGMLRIREVAGDRFLLGCGAPLLPSVGIVDGMRIGSDVAAYWGDEGNSDGPALRNATRATLARGWMHGRWWANDPDCVIVRAADTQLSLAEVEAWAAVVALSGGMLFVGDDVSRVEPERLALLARLIPPSGQAAEVGPPLLNRMPSRLHLRVRRAWGEWSIVGIANWLDVPANATFDPLDFGLDAACHVFDLIRGHYLGRCSGSLGLGEIEPHGLRLLSIHPDLGRPQTVGSTGHLLGEAMDLAREVLGPFDADTDARAERERPARPRRRAARRRARRRRAASRTPPRCDRAPLRMKVAIVGSGGVARRHLAVLARLPDTTLVGHVSHDLGRAEAQAAEWGGAAFSDVVDLLERARPDAVWVCVTPDRHGALEDALIERGVPFFVEKPLAVDVPTAEAIAARLQQTGLIVGVGYKFRALDCLEPAHDLLAQTPPRMVLGAWHAALPSPPWWRVAARSGGQFVEQAAHLVDLARLLVGEGEVVSAMARRWERSGAPGSDVPDVSAALLRFATPDGWVPGTFSATCLLEGSQAIHLQLVCDGRVLTISESALVVDSGRNRAEHPNTSDPFDIEDRAFLQAVRTRDSSLLLSSYADALNTHRLCCAIRDAS